MIELLELEYFLAVAEEGSVTRAAERAYRTQPAISQSIKKLEDQLGAPLFTRDLHDVSLTDAGTRNVASNESAAIYLLPAALRPDTRAFPDSNGEHSRQQAQRDSAAGSRSGNARWLLHRRAAIQSINFSPGACRQNGAGSDYPNLQLAVQEDARGAADPQASVSIRV